MADDRIKREIEDILSRLDDLPAERKPIPIRRRSSGSAGAFGRALVGPLAHISLRNVMLTALVLVIVGFFGMRVSVFGQWLLIAGLLLFFTTFALSFFGRKSAPQYEKRWRGQPMDLSPASFGDRLRAWLQAKRNQRR